LSAMIFPPKFIVAPQCLCGQGPWISFQGSDLPLAEQLLMLGLNRANYGRDTVRF